MGSTAYFSSGNVAGLWAPLQGFLSWWVSRPLNKENKNEAANRLTARPAQQALAASSMPLHHRGASGVKPLTCFQVRSKLRAPAGGQDSDTHGKAPSRLRILREFEPGASPACAGRMVISGRMADVCAELDRMTIAQRSAH